MLLNSIKEWRYSKKDLQEVLENYNYIGVCLTYLILFILFFIIANFTKFHVELILKNNTTLEHLDSIRAKKEIIKEYDMGKYYNWISVFGKKKVFWFLLACINCSPSFPKWLNEKRVSIIVTVPMASHVRWVID
jgi:hypothetical protein